MLGNQERWQEDILIACPLRDLVPDDHILKLVDSVLDLSWLKNEGVFSKTRCFHVTT